ncbi:DUF1289 domain-containing protein [Psychrobium sp. MM17-31]|uniref:DUF1289 domain-containing protein n=1 Tax=Psychrobium sp. MM17-31 TaxID=2917758 RepID=UPI0023B821F9|nr:DUF1289 domain-containing protein [Psychrobium sp. MM17-31]
MKNELRDQLQLFTIESPCIGICEVNNRGYCKGCFRSRDERFYWHRLSDADKSKVIRLCQRRKRRKQSQSKGGDDSPSPNLSLF